MVRASLTFDRSAASTMKRYWTVGKPKKTDGSSESEETLDEGLPEGKTKKEREPQGRAVNRKKNLMKKMPVLEEMVAGDE